MDVFNTDWDLAIGDEIFAVASHALALKTREKGNSFIMMATCVQMNPMRYYLSLGMTGNCTVILLFQVGTTSTDRQCLRR